MEKLDELIERVDKELAKVTPGTDSWGKLLAQREDLLRQKDMLVKHKKSKIDPNVVAQCITGVVQVVGVAVVGFLTRIDKEALRFIKKP